jgi:hypothetical protein
VAPVEIKLPLSADPAQRSKQVLQALISSVPSAEERTIPADAELLGFYALPDGTAVADFSDALVSEIPSGILSEQLIVDSITQTLQSNVPSLMRLKILIHGQEVETLAGHVDLTGFFDLNPPLPSQTPSDAVPATPARNGSSSPDTTAAPPPSGPAASPKQPERSSDAKP